MRTVGRAVSITGILSLVVYVSGLVTPAIASAFYIQNFKVRDSGAWIRYYVTVCTPGRERVLARSYLHTDMGIGPVYSKNWAGSQESSCTRWEFGQRDRFLDGQWDAQLRIVVDGRAKYTPIRYFEIR